MFDSRKKEVLSLLSDAVDKDLKILNISAGITPLGEVMNLLDAYFRERNEFLTDLSEIFKTDNKSLSAKKQMTAVKEGVAKRPDYAEHKKKIVTELIEFKEKSVRKNKNRDLKNVRIYVDLFFQQEASFYMKLATHFPKMGAIQGNIIFNKERIRDLHDDLSDKWNRTDDAFDSINDKAKNQIKRIEYELRRAITEIREELEKTKKLSSSLVFSGADKAAEIVPLGKVITGAFKKVFDKVRGIKKHEEIIQDHFTRTLKFFMPVSIMFSRVKGDVQEYIKEVGLDKTVGEYNKTKSNVERTLRDFGTAGQVSDSTELFKIVLSYVTANLEDFYKVHANFIKSHKEIFLGALSPAKIDELLARKDFEKILSDFGEINLKSSILEYYHDVTTHWIDEIELKDDKETEKEREALKDLIKSYLRVHEGELKLLEYNAKDQVKKAGEKVHDTVVDFIKK